MKKHRDKVEEQKQTNVSDGDSRPDKPDEDRKREKPVTPERGADVNTIEDAKDARQ